MPTLVIEYATEAERLRLEQLIAYGREMDRVCTTAAHGTVLDACEQFALDRGRQLLRDNLAAAVQERVAAPKKSPEPVSRAASVARS
jgi:hypothetical protein